MYDEFTCFHCQQKEHEEEECPTQPEEDDTIPPLNQFQDAINLTNTQNHSTASILDTDESKDNFPPLST